LRLYAELESSVAVELADTWASDERLHDFSLYVEAEVREHGRLDPDGVADYLDIADDTDGRRYAYLCAIDAAMELVHPATDTADRLGLYALAIRFSKHNRFNTDPRDGALLPRFAFPDRIRAMADEVQIEHKADLFTNVVVVDAQQWSTVGSVRVPRHYSPPATTRLDGLFVGCAPVCGGDDVEIVCIPAPPRRRYEIAPAGPGPGGRIASIIDQLDASGAHIGLMPELTLNPGLLENWQRALASTPPPPGSRLRLVMVGTGPFEPRPDRRHANRAFLLGRDGEIVFCQDKRHPFTLDADTVRTWALETALGEGAAAEPIVAGKRLAVAEGTFGRMIVLVCEDLGRKVEDGPLLLAVGSSLCLAPVLSKPTLKHYWEHSSAKAISAEIGSNTVVSNSLVIADRQRDAGMGPEGEGTALAHTPQGAVCGHALDPGEVVVLILHPDGAYQLTSETWDR
jgi:predicted amidohydrolase